MPFAGFLIRGVDSDTDLLVPRVTPDGSAAVVGGDADGAIDNLNAKSLAVAHLGKSKQHEIVTVDSLSISMAVTDSRVAYWCKKYDKGGGWVGGGIGGLAIAGVANAVSKARASNRRRGNCLVGHARYTWLHGVGYSTKSGVFGRKQTLRLLMVDGTEGKQRPTFAIDFTLGADVSAHKVASEIVKRVARFRLAHHPDLSDEQREKLESIGANGVPGGNDGSRFTIVGLPGALVVSESTAVYRASEEKPLEGESSTSSSDKSGLPDPPEALAGQQVLIPVANGELSGTAQAIAELLGRAGSSTFEEIGLDLSLDLRAVSEAVKELERHDLVTRSRGGTYALVGEQGVDRG